MGTLPPIDRLQLSTYGSKPPDFLALLINNINQNIEPTYTLLQGNLTCVQNVDADNTQSLTIIAGIATTGITCTVSGSSGNTLTVNSTVGMQPGYILVQSGVQSVILNVVSTTLVSVQDTLTWSGSSNATTIYKPSLQGLNSFSPNIKHFPTCCILGQILNTNLNVPVDTTNVTLRWHYVNGVIFIDNIIGLTIGVQYKINFFVV
jgi:hypothetical protein